jgi:hypothetical protein
LGLEEQVVNMILTSLQTVFKVIIVVLVPSHQSAEVEAEEPLQMVKLVDQVVAVNGKVLAVLVVMQEHQIKVIQEVLQLTKLDKEEAVGLQRLVFLEVQAH